MISVSNLEQVIAKSEQFDDELFSMFQGFEFSDDNRSSAVVTMCHIAHEHAISLRELTRIRLLTSAMGMLRLENGFQYLPRLSAEFFSCKIYMCKKINMIVISCWKI
jgi:hypothetical protein